jgi:lambda family phage portal protein
VITLNLETPSFAEIRAERRERERAETRDRKRLRRSYDAAKLNRLTADWTTVSTSANFELRRSLRVLRARSRNLARNSDYVKKFLSMVRNNVSGPAGMMLQCRALTPKGEPDETLNRKVEAAWKQWSHRENASASGRLSWRDIQRKADTLMARDGEALVRAVPADNPFGFALRFYSADWLDEVFNERLTNGNRVIMSVELDAHDRPAAYWLTPPPADYQHLDSGVRVRTRVPAEEIIHLYLPDDENADDDSQTRGVPWTHAVMGRLKMLGGYEDAVVTGARAGANKMGFFQETEPEEHSYTGEEGDEDAEARGGELMESAQPGTFGIIPKGYEFKEYNPSSPDTNHGAFIKTELRGIAAGLDVTYFSLAEDLEGVNYSSARVGLLAERDTWRGLQELKKEHFCRRVFVMWLRSAMLSGALDIRVSDYKRLQEPAWHARGWTWVDPAKEAEATVTAINNGFDTLTDTLAEQGRDFDHVIETRKRELKKLADAGIEIAPAKPASPPQKPQGQQGDSAENT